MKPSLLFLAASLISFPFAASANQTAGVDIIRAEFGLFDASNPAEIVFEPGTTVPRKNGQRYGWVIDVRTSHRSLVVREAYVLATPGSVSPTTTATPPAPGAHSERIDIPVLRRHEVSQRQLVPVDGKIYGEWAIGPNEPAGHRHLQVTIENEAIADFEYDVQ